MAVKIIRNNFEAEKEKNNLDKVDVIASGCPGIVPYYGMKKL